jgi:hypothetical protein
MPTPHMRPESSLMPVLRPRCPKCESRMMLASITPGPEGFDLRTFECKRCDHSYTTAIARDPMNAVSAGWVASELRAPT